MISIVIPRIRDFRGLSPKAFDKRGNYTFGLTDQSMFPEISIDMVEFTQGMDITLVISGNSDEQSRELLKQLGMPFKVRGIRSRNGKKMSYRKAKKGT